MAKKKTKKKTKKKGRKSTGSRSDKGPSIKDFRAMEKVSSDLGRLLREREFASAEEANAFLRQLLDSGEPLPPAPPCTPLEEAQDLMYKAWDSSGKQRVKLARQALEICADCADAYVLLAEESATSLEQARDLYQQGVKAGERALGRQAFEEDVGHFWGILETRPYMRARAGLAECLWLLGERRKAIEHYTDLLRLNPGDNQGIRYVLINCLLIEGDDEAMEKLVDEYQRDSSAMWLYSRALWTFRREGASSKAKRLLKKSLERNPYVPLYLLGIKKITQDSPAFIGIGDESEAVAYAYDAVEIWLKTPGALEWLISSVKQIRT